jgi:hypothetical protein
MIQLRAVAASALILGAGMILTACSGSTVGEQDSGGSAPGAPTVRSVMNTATSVHLFGHLLIHGTVVGVDMSVTRSGDMYGTVTQGAAPIGVLKVAGKFYILATKTFLEMEGVPAAKCASICGKYVAEPPQAGSGFASVQMASLLRDVAAALPAHLDTDGKRITLDGQPAVSFPGSATTVDVAANGQPYPLLLIAAGGKTNLELSAWNKAVIPAPPGPAQVAKQ